MAAVEKFNLFIDDVNAAEDTNIPHGDNILECLNNYLEGRSLIEDRYTTLDKAIYDFCAEAFAIDDAAATQIASLNGEINGAISSINTELSSTYESLETAVAGIIAAYEAAITPATPPSDPEVTG